MLDFLKDFMVIFPDIYDFLRDFMFF